MPTDPQSPEAEVPVAVSVVVVENGQRPSEPYLGRPPQGDACYVFGQHPMESAFVLDLRLRDCVSDLLDAGHRIKAAILVWDHLEPTRDLSRRIQLLARRLGPGSQLIVCDKQPSASFPRQNARFAELINGLTTQLAELGVKLCVHSAADRQAPAALSAIWQRVGSFPGTQAELKQQSERPARPSRVVGLRQPRRRSELSQSGILPRALADCEATPAERARRSS